MATHLVRYAALTMFLALTPVARGEEKLTVKPADTPPPMQLKEEVRKLLTGNSLQVLDAKGELKCELWLRKVVPVMATETQIKNGLTYQEVPATTILAVIRFPATFKDYKKQDVDPGTYLLRLGMQPQDGDHMGTAPHQEFCLLTSPEFDTKPDLMEPKALVDVSARTMSGSHPGILLLFPNAKPGDTAQVVDQGQGHWVLKARLEVDAAGKKGFIGMALTVAGHSASIN